jgi:NCS2 family nucleobase:cation symporter-2
VPIRPPQLVYAVDEPPPWLQRVVLAVQHVIVMSVGWIFIVLAVTLAGGTTVEAGHVIRMSMVASGIGTILQARTRGAVGSGYLCPFSAGPAYLSASIAAGAAGGLPLVFGLTAIAGVFEALVSRVIRRLRALFPPEVTGLVVSMVGIELIALGAPRFIGVSTGASRPDAASFAVALVTLAAMIVPTVWSRGKLRLYPVLLGLLTGYAVAFGTGVLTAAEIGAAMSVPALSLPERAASGWAFDSALLVPFLIASVTSSLKSVGDLTLCQKINDADWKRTDLRSVAGGLLAGSVATLTAGVLGGAGQSTFSSNVGLSAATGATSRAIALPCGLLVVSLAFFPRLTAAFTSMPPPVMGAVLVYVACYMIIGGLQVMASRMLDARRTFVVGVSLFFGLSVEMVPGMYAGAPPMLHPLFANSLSLTTVLAVALNLLFRLGIAERATLELRRGDGAARIFAFLEAQGAAWGARPDVIRHAASAINECFEIAIGARLTAGPIVVVARFDELSLDVELSYQGRPIVFSGIPPTKSEVIRDPSGGVRLAAFLVRQMASRVETVEQDGRCRVLLHFEH